MNATELLHQTLSDYAASKWKGNNEYDGLDAVVEALANGSHKIHAKVQAAALANVLGATGETNVQGEIVQILDTFASDTFVDVLSKSGRVAAVGSEEIEGTVVVGDGPKHNYILQFDPSPTTTVPSISSEPWLTAPIRFMPRCRPPPSPMSWGQQVRLTSRARSCRYWTPSHPIPLWMC